MVRARTTLKLLIFGGLLSAMACSGSLNCSGCGNGTLMPIPGGFNPAAQIEKSAQIRVTNRGFDFIESSFQDLMGAYLRMTCGATDDIPCPTGFVTVPGNMPNPSSCDAVQGTCVEQVSGDPGPLIGFEIDQSTSNGAIVCRDDLNDPNRRPCYAWLRFEGLQLTPRAPDSIDAIVTAQIDSTEIPFRYDNLGMDCLVRINSNASGTALQDLTLTAHVGEWTPPSGTGGRQLKISVSDVGAMIPDTDVEIEDDPVHGDFADILLCGIANLGVVKNALIPQLTGTLGDVVADQIAQALGMQCTGPNGFICPAQTTCDLGDGFCKEDASGDVVPTIIGTEGRLDFSSLLGGLLGGRPGQGDISFLVGGMSTADSNGIDIGMLGGAEVVTPDPSCAMILPSPRLRPGWTAPPPLPTAETVDLDFDGTPETPYMLAAGISEDLLKQFLWTIYTDGLFCASISGYDADALNTSALGLLMPSLNKLTHGDKYRYAIFPARITLFEGAEPQISIGSGKTSTASNTPMIEEPLIDLFLDDLTVSFQALVEDRWVHLMTVTQDVHLNLGAVVTPANEIQLVIGDIAMSISNVHVTDSEILAEDPHDLEAAIPALLQIALPQLTGAFPPFPLPTGMDLGGFKLTVLGIRGVEGSPSSYPNMAVYTDLDFDPSLVPPLAVAADTSARIHRIDMPRIEELSVSAGAKIPVAELELDGAAPDGASLEYQVRVDGSLWTPFFKPTDGIYAMRRPELMAQGHHHVEVRARVAGEYQTLDPTPVALDVVIDAEPPHLDARLAARDGGLVVHAYDGVSRDHVLIEVGANNVYRAIVPDADGFVAVPEVIEPDNGIRVRATDEQGLTQEIVLREQRGLSAEQPNLNGESSEHNGCECTRRAGRSMPFADVLLSLFALVYVARAREGRAR